MKHITVKFNANLLIRINNDDRSSNGNSNHSNHSNHSSNLIGSIINNIIIGNIADNASAYGDYKSSIISTMTTLDTLLNAYSIKLCRNDSTNTNGIMDIIDNLDNYYLDFRTR